MSRSTRLPITKDRPRNGKKSTEYWRRVRHVQNGQTRMIKSLANADEWEIDNEKTIMNDYDYSDYTFDDRWTDSDWADKEKRK